MRNDPEYIALAGTTAGIVTTRDLGAYHDKRNAILYRICEDPKIVAWTKQLEGML